MEIVNCKNGHFYDAKRYVQCPYCEEQMRNEIEYLNSISSKFTKLGTISLIGRGSTSRVFKIKGTNTYALKVIKCGSDPSKYQNALYEIKVMKHLNGVSSTVGICDSEWIEKNGEKCVYILETYHTSLSNYLSDRAVSVTEAIEIVIGVCNALIDCKKAGIIHLDIQPKNIFIDDIHSVKLGDFSSSLFVNDLKGNHTMRGTLAFMAPEAYREKCCSEQSDIYSVGIILYCLFNKKTLPFMDSDNKEVAVYKRLAGTPFPDIAFSDESIKSEIQKVIQEACEYDPDKRIQSFEILHKRLNQLYERVKGTDTGQAVLFPGKPTSPILPLAGSAKDIGSSKTPYTFNADSAKQAADLFDADSLTYSTALFPPEADDIKRSETMAGAPRAPRAKKPGHNAIRIGRLGEGNRGRKGILDRNIERENCAEEKIPSASMPNKQTFGKNMYCGACGNPLEHMARFCTKCGRRIQVEENEVNQSKVDFSAAAPVCANCGSKVQGEENEVNLSKVHFSAVAPKKFVKGDYTIIDIVMYEEAFRHVVEELLREAEEPVQETKSGLLKVQTSSSIRICLTSPDIEIEDNEETRQWQGEYLDFSFAVLLPEQYKKRKILFNASVFVNDIIATRLKFTAKCSSFLEQKLTITREDILSAFVSYASQDRNRVAAIIQGMKKVRPDMDVFFDVDSLRSGEDWEKTLRYEIEKRDILFLCWSHFARQSKWVDTEWRYALELKGIECIEPVPIEPPNVCPPPEELKQKHFNDKLLYIVNAGNS